VLLRIGELLQEGLNLAGVAKVLELEAANVKLHRALQRARSRPQ
jgi:MerR family transcriptional regulator, heat shock protein HspR